MCVSSCLNLLQAEKIYLPVWMNLIRRLSTEEDSCKEIEQINYTKHQESLNQARDKTKPQRTSIVQNTVSQIGDFEELINFGDLKSDYR